MSGIGYPKNKLIIVEILRSEPPHNFGKRIIEVPKEQWKLAYLAGIIDGEEWTE